MGKNRVNAFYVLCRPNFAIVKSSSTTISRQKAFVCNLKARKNNPAQEFCLALTVLAILLDFFNIVLGWRGRAGGGGGGG